MTHGKTQGVYPAARHMLAALYEGALVDVDTAIRIEARRFTAPCSTRHRGGDDPHPLPLQAGAGEGRGRPGDEPDARVSTKLGVLGAG